jgi:alkylation response protein AidB-like acyl-CoA dehydrogenase
MKATAIVREPLGKEMDELCEALATHAGRWRSTEDWPEDSLRLCAQAGVYRWFLPAELGGADWDPVAQTRGYLRLAQADLVSTFIITQYMGAVRRIVGANQSDVANEWLERLVSGEAFATVGISHLTTSRRHLDRPVLRATASANSWQLDGMTPWVTGASKADLLVVGAVADSGDELLLAVPTTTPGVQCGTGLELMALSASKTDEVTFESVNVSHASVLAGPQPNVMQSGLGAGTGGLQTTTLALGLSRAALDFLQDEAQQRKELWEVVAEFNNELDDLQDLLLRAAAGAEEYSANDLRSQANRLVMRVTQAGLVAAKGAGFLDSHPVARWCRQAMFFLVWSCPHPVTQTHLCELAGI